MNFADAASGLLLAALGTFVALKARGFGLGTLAEPGAGFFPFWGGVLILACAAAIVAQAFARARAGKPSAEAAPRATNWKKVSLCVAVLLAYAAALPLVGFGMSTFGVMFALSRFDARTSWRGSLAIAGLGALGFWVLFVRLLAVRFPPPAFGFF